MALRTPLRPHTGPWPVAAARPGAGTVLRVRTRPGGRPEAPSVALVHGFEETWDTWAGVGAALPADLHLHGLELPWQANSDYRWTDDGSSVAWLDRSLDLLPRRPDLVVGHSFGASTLLQLLIRRGERPGMRGAVLVAPVHRPHDDVVDPRFFAEAVHRFRHVMQEGMRVRLGPRGRTLPASLVTAMYDRFRDRVEPDGFLQFYSVIARTPTLAAERVAVPVLVISGTDDPAAPTEAVADLVRRLPRARAATSAWFSHFCQVEQAEPIADLISAFLTELGASTSHSGSVMPHRRTPAFPDTTTPVTGPEEAVTL